MTSGANESTCTTDNRSSCLVDIPDTNFCAYITVTVNVHDSKEKCPGVESEGGVIT